MEQFGKPQVIAWVFEKYWLPREKREISRLPRGFFKSFGSCEKPETSGLPRKISQIFFISYVPYIFSTNFLLIFLILIVSTFPPSTILFNKIINFNS